MKLTARIIGFLLLVIGAVWFFQGINILPGSFMTGQKLWAVIGGACVVTGIIILLPAFNNKRR